MLSYKVSRNWFWSVFYKDFHNKAFSPNFAYKAMAVAYNKTEDQVRAHKAANRLIKNFNDRLAAKIQAANEDCSQECFEELDQQVKEMVDTLAWSVFHEIYDEGGRGWPSTDRAKQILKWRNTAAQNQRKGRQGAAQAPKNTTSAGKRPKENTTAGITRRTKRRLGSGRTNGARITPTR